MHIANNFLVGGDENGILENFSWFISDLERSRKTGPEIAVLYRRQTNDN
jgi:hypothetical protein